MTVITISRQMGSLGRQIASLTAQTLGYRLVWRDLWDIAARQIGHPELALAAIDELGLLGICPAPRLCRAYQQAIQEVMKEIASQGNVVIVGRAGQSVLRDQPGVIHVRVIAPLPIRVTRVAKNQNISSECAQAQVLDSDRFRRNFLRRHYHVNWDDPALYDLVLNTERLLPSAAAELVCQAARQVGSSIETG
jgi:cytidylate kinase